MNGSTLYHSPHSCGHAVYWFRASDAVSFAPYPCPWCGGEAGKPIPIRELVIADQATGQLLAIRRLLDDNRVPWPEAYPAPPGQVTIRHLPGDRCCKPKKPWPDGW